MVYKYILLLLGLFSFMSCENTKSVEDLVYKLYISDLYGRINEVYLKNKTLYEYNIASNETNLTLLKENRSLLIKLETIYELGKKTDSVLATTDSKYEALESFEKFSNVVVVNYGYKDEVKDLFNDDFINSSVKYRIVFLRFFLESIIGVTYLIGTD
jgi:hypothetical protein